MNEKKYAVIECYNNNSFFQSLNCCELVEQGKHKDKSFLKYYDYYFNIENFIKAWGEYN